MKRDLKFSSLLIFLVLFTALPAPSAELEDSQIETIIDYGILLVRHEQVWKMISALKESDIICDNGCRALQKMAVKLPRWSALDKQEEKAKTIAKELYAGLPNEEDLAFFLLSSSRWYARTHYEPLKQFDTSRFNEADSLAKIFTQILAFEQKYYAEHGQELYRQVRANVEAYVKKHPGR